MSLEDLLKRVESTSGVDRELGAMLLCFARNATFLSWETRVTGCSPHLIAVACAAEGDRFEFYADDPTGSIDAALALVEEKMTIEWPSYEVHARMVRSGGEWFHFFEITVPSREFHGRSRHAPIALLKCLLRALISQKETAE